MIVVVAATVNCQLCFFWLRIIWCCADLSLHKTVESVGKSVEFKLLHFQRVKGCWIYRNLCMAKFHLIKARNLPCSYVIESRMPTEVISASTQKASGCFKQTWFSVNLLEILSREIKLVTLFTQFYHWLSCYITGRDGGWGKQAHRWMGVFSGRAEPQG